MIRVLTCIQADHDLRLVLLAGAICAFSSILSISLHCRAPRGRHSGNLIAGLIAGAGIWSTHFIAMLAFRPGFTTGYAPAETFGSLVVAMVLCTLGFCVAATGRLKRPWLVAGPVIGWGVALMHYTGMAGFRAEGVLSWAPSYVASSVALGVAFTTAALFLARPGTILRKQVYGALLLTLGICALHFTGMTAVTVTPDSSIFVPRSSLSHLQLAFVAAGLTVFFLVVTAGLYVTTRTRRIAFGHLREAIAAMPDGMAIFDADQKLVAWNGRFVEFLGSPDGIVYGAPRSRVLDLPTVAGTAGEANSPFHSQGRWWRVDHRPTGNGGSVSVFVDVTFHMEAEHYQAALIEELKLTETRLIHALEAARDASQAKSAFLANMSHELRTPLNGVIGLTGALMRRVRDPESQEMISLIEHSGRTLERVLSDILDISKIEARKISMETSDFALLREVEVAVLPFAAKAQEKGIELIFDRNGCSEITVAGDALRLRQILSNLVSNAVKFTDQGAVRVSADLAEAEEGYVAVFTVEDSGVGFDPAQLDRLFQAFEQEDVSTTRRFGGTGLGLPICRGLAEVLGGELTATSRPGEGSCFTLTLPLRRAGPAAEAAPGEIPAVVASNLRILLAEDHPTNQRVIELLLEPFEAEIVIVEDGQAALAALADQPFDLVLMDMQMPVMDGLDATRELRRRELQAGRPRLPVAMLTANVSNEFVAMSLDAGADHHIAKPISLETLVSGIETCLAVAARRDETAQSAA